MELTPEAAQITYLRVLKKHNDSEEEDKNPRWYVDNVRRVERNKSTAKKRLFTDGI